MMNETDDVLWESVATASGMAQANIIVGRLESEGISTQLHYEAAGTIYAITIDGLGEVRILVPVPDWEKANEILSRSYSEGDLAWESNTGEPPNGTRGRYEKDDKTNSHDEGVK
ncbi:MAG: DUF2007 domain-containing protein [Deltaproteobacteria bacterium]|nr:DUF2007 domain-containing protein [Deltaproteobacteria bacterium]